MKRLHNVFGWLFVLFILCGVLSNRASAQPTITNPEVSAVTVNGIQTGTDNTQFIFRAVIDFGQNQAPVDLYSGTGQTFGAAVAVFIDPRDEANPERDATNPAFRPFMFPMVLAPGTSPFGAQTFIAYIPGSAMAGGSGGSWNGRPAGQHGFSIVARNNATGGTFMNGVQAGPKPAQQFNIVVSGGIEVTPVDPNYQPDFPGALGNGLRVDPQDPTSANDGGSAAFYTFRVRIRTPGGLPPEFFNGRGLFEWRDYRADTVTLLQRWNSGVYLVLIDPQGGQHVCPMEIDPDAPGQGGGPISPLQASTYAPDTVTNSFFHPVGNPAWALPNGTGIFYRYRMMPTQYQPANFGGPTAPDNLLAIQVGALAPPEVVGRPFANGYTAFAAALTPPLNFPVVTYPVATGTANHSGQWRYLYKVTTDLRPVGNGSQGTYPAERYGTAPGAYFTNLSSTFNHPLLTPMASDGGWTDDLPENNFLQPYLTYAGTSNNSHRSRVTTKTHVRFEVRVTKSTATPLPGNAVQVYIDGTPFSMQALPIPGNNNFANGVIYYYDTNFPPGMEGQHWIYFRADDGIHQTIWPRRPHLQGDPAAADPQYPDVQAARIPSHSDATNFYGLTVGKNYLNEPYVNHRPTLTNPTVTPASGAEGQPYTYEVVYTDADNDEPFDAIVYIDGTDAAHAHRMTQVDGTPTSQGRRYRFQLTSLVPTPDRKHTYFFKFRDNWGTPIAREYGEFVTLPQGDDAGNPSGVVSGPIIVGNNPPELLDPAFFPGDPANTPATLYDFVIRYKDADNDAPAYVRFFISADGGNTYDAGTGMVKAENSNSYTTGVQYHLPNRIRLPVGSNYRIKFTASDGVNTQETTLIHVGTGSDAIATGTAHTFAPTDGTNLVFIDPIGSRKWLNNTATFFFWKGTGSTPTLLLYNDPGPNGYTVDFVNGRITLNTPSTVPIRGSYFYLELLGPTVNPNHAPTLKGPGTDPTDNYKTLTPLQGSPTDSFNFSIIYTDQDNQPPAYVNLVIDTKTTVAMTIDPATPTPIDYTRGVRYNVTVPGSTIGPGTSHRYHFEASDGADLGRFPLATDNPNELSGPQIVDVGNLQSPLIQPFPKGKSTDQYTFTVTYKNANGLAPTADIEVRIKATTGNTVTPVKLNPIDPIGPTQYQNGVRYQVALTAPNAPLTPGSHEVTFGFAGFGAATTPQTLIVNGVPVLTSVSVLPNPASRAGDVTFQVTYSDLNGDAPSGGTPTLTIDGAAFTAVTPTVTPANPTSTDYQNGVHYVWVVPGSTFTVGTHNFLFTASDGLESATPGGGTFTMTAAQQPQLIEPNPGTPTTNNGTLSPLKGPRSAQYTFSIRYRHGDNVPPVKIQVIIDGDTANAKTMTTAVQSPNYADPNGVLFSYTTQPNELTSGSHTYKFHAEDRLATVDQPSSGTYTGPTINFAPVLSSGTVFIQGSTTVPTVDQNNNLNPPVKGNIQTQFVFRVTYTDQDNVAPGNGGFVKARINNAIDVPMHVKTGDPQNWAAGVVYESDPTTLTSGQKAFHFDASDGQDPGRFPAGSAEISGLTVANLPALSVPNPPPATDDGTLIPRSGPLSTVYTYSIVYKNADNTPPAYVRVFIDGTAFDMTKVGTGANYSSGVTYQYQTRFQTGGAHKYHFEAADTVSTSFVARYPATGELNGPTVNVPSFSPPTFTPNPGVIGGEMTVSGALLTQPPLATQINVQLVKPDGTGITTTTTTDTNGLFSFKFTPDQTGDWKVRLTWNGSQGTYDPITSEFPFKVTGFTLQLDAGVVDLIASPLVPVTPDPATTFNATRPDGTPLSVTVLDLIKWVPNVVNGQDQGSYRFLNNDANFPGITGGQAYWVKPSETTVLNPRGKLWDQTQPFSIPLAAGWNTIGSVYLQDINWSAVQVRFNGAILPIDQAGDVIRPVAWAYDKTTGGYRTIGSGNTLQTGHGYWVRALQACELILPPPGTRAATASRAADLTANSLQIVVRTGNRMEQDNYFSLNGSNQSRMVVMDKPPYISDYVTVHFLTSDSVQLPSDTRVAATGQNVIAFEVRTDHKNADVSVQFPNVGTLGRKYEFTLIDLSNNTRKALGTSSGITYNSGDTAAPRRFAVVIDQRLANSTLVISNLQSSSRGPAGLTFNYNVSGSATMRAQIVGATGQVIRELAQGRAATRGANSLTWDGKDGRGIAVPTGTYILKLSATDDNGRAASAVLPVTLVR